VVGGGCGLSFWVVGVLFVSCGSEKGNPNGRPFFTSTKAGESSPGN